VSTRGYSPVWRVNPLYQLMAGPVFWAADIVWDYQPWKLPLTFLWFLPVTAWLSQRSYSWEGPVDSAASERRGLCSSP
jgi:hypothetical protein